MSEPDEILRTFQMMLAGPTNDGQVKRTTRNKPLWKVDPGHEEAMMRHLHRYGRGELFDVDSGCHALVHVAWRALAIAWQETHALTSANDSR